MKKRYYYRYSAYDSTGKAIIFTNDLSHIMGEAKRANFEVRKRLPDLRLGRRVFKNRYSVIRHIDKSGQIPFEFKFQKGASR